jgi:hypothetical protein
VILPFNEDFVLGKLFLLSESHVLPLYNIHPVEFLRV